MNFPVSTGKTIWTTIDGIFLVTVTFTIITIALIKGIIVCIMYNASFAIIQGVSHAI